MSTAWHGAQRTAERRARRRTRTRTWPGIGLGLVLLAAFVLVGRGLGASGAFNSVVAWA